MKTILISGGSDGLGKAIAEKLASDNKVIILSPTEHKLQKAAASFGGEYRICDVSDYNWVESVVREIGQIDCVINGAGLWVQGPLEDNDPQRIREVLEVNTLGTINMTKAVIPTMKKQHNGLIINIISQTGLTAKAERSVYTASKWAITGFTRAIQSELAEFGIRVTGLYPGKLNTDMFKKMGIDKSMEDALDPDEVAKTVDFILSLNANILLPEIGIKNIDN